MGRECGEKDSGLKGSYFGSRWRRDRGTFYARFSKAVVISRSDRPLEKHFTSFPRDFRAYAGEAEFITSYEKGNHDKIA